MGSEYDRKFDEMKKYIPFLENMIARLENSNSASTNPRQAQLDKIRSLRDLLINKKKRMKMENLLKCEQVLVNLYAKVEQKEFPESKAAVDSVNDRNPKEQGNLETVRHKLKNIALKMQSDDTLPEIARANEIEEVCTPGSKEPALFQRRPNKNSISPQRIPPENSKEVKSQSKRGYTRVLVSPETSQNRWSAEGTSDMLLGTRRSPMRSPKIQPSPFYRRDRKKSSKNPKPEFETDDKKQGKIRADITLKVPQQSLNELKPKDIFNRIIDCNEHDVDIKTLRELRSKIIGELKQTGANEDISELILKSYGSTNAKKKKKKRSKDDVEEGELSDSESEVIDNVYGSLVVVDKEAGSSQSKQEDSGQRKIQICLVLGENTGESTDTAANEAQKVEENEKDIIVIDSDSPVKASTEQKIDAAKVKKSLDFDPAEEETVITIDDSDNTAKVPALTEPVKHKTVEIRKSPVRMKSPAKIAQSPSLHKEQPNDFLPTLKQLEELDKSTEKVQFSANFYKPLDPDEKKNEDTPKTLKSSEQITQEKVPNTEKPQSEPEAPRNESSANKTRVSEIDILQALKNEILNETALPLSSPEVDTPALHQPKLSKVANAKELQPKKRISIEKYKKMSSATSTNKVTTPPVKESIDQRDNKAKQSIKLTEKEAQRFNLPATLGEDPISDDEDYLLDDTPISPNDVYADLAPKSPDFEAPSTLNTPPVIIPVEPVKPPKKAPVKPSDVDMRPMLAPKPVPPPVSFNTIPVNPEPLPKDMFDPKRPPPLMDPRVRKDLNQPTIKDSPNPFINTDILSKPGLLPNIPPLMNLCAPSYSPSMTSIRTPNARSFDMTPTRQSIDTDESSNRTHVYAPNFYESIDKESSSNSSWDHNNRDMNEDRNSRRNERTRWDDLSRSTSLQRDSDSRYRYDKYNQNAINDKFHLDRREYSKLDCPPTPVPSFGWSECPSTPSSGFGRQDPKLQSRGYSRMDCPTTPIHPFGRSDCPSTPNHPFGRSDCPSTPSHPFGRSDCPTTPSHPFGLAECPKTPSHPFGRNDAPPSNLYGRPDARPEGPKNNAFNKDPRLNRRQSEYESSPKYEDNRGYKNDRGGYNRGSYHNANSRYDSRNYDKEQSGRRSDRYYSNEGGRSFDGGRSYESNRKYDSGRNYRDGPDNMESEENRYYSRNRDSRKYERGYEEVGSRRHDREKSVGRSDDRHRSNGRSPSLVKTLTPKEDNKLSVQSDAGRSFTIDTSVNSSFQNLIESRKEIPIFNYSFDARRKRASSVGRASSREGSVSRTLTKIDTQEKETVEPVEKVNRFQRAASVGRDLVPSGQNNNEKSLKDIKAEFEAFQVKIGEQNVKKVVQKLPDRPRRDNLVQITEAIEKKQAYSPRKNYRDPRMRREQNSKNKNDNHNRDRRHSGIVYSSDNIAKGTIMGTGFGVKNYKIPKIKRVDSEEPKPDTKTDSVESKTEQKSDKKENTATTAGQNVKPTKINNAKEQETTQEVSSVKPTEEKDILQKKKSENKSLDVVITETEAEETKVSTPERRLTRSSKKMEAVEEKASVKKKNRRTVIDSDSDDDIALEQVQKEIKQKTSPKKTKNASPVKKKVAKKSSPIDEVLFDPTFAMDDLDMFSDPIDSDMDNINDIIADLDTDLNSTKDVCPSEIENMLSAIDGPEGNSFADISDVIQNDLNETTRKSLDKPAESPVPKKIEQNEQKSDIETTISAASTETKNDEIDKQEEIMKKQHENEAIVSTTKEDVSEQNICDSKKVDSDEQSAPDSTINKPESSKPDSVPDSTNQIAETTSDVSSTDNENKPAETASSEPKLDSISTILSILQDKSKLKEILSMLGEQYGESDKIKKKLSEILLEDEEDRTVTEEKNETASVEPVNSETDKVESTSEPQETVDDTKESKTEEAPKDESTPVDTVINEDSVDSIGKEASEETLEAPADDQDEENADAKEPEEQSPLPTKPPPKKRGRKPKKIPVKKAKTISTAPKRNAKPRNRELAKLHEDIKEMFMSDDILNANGIRMCRLAKFVNEKKEESLQEARPVVVLEKFNNADVAEAVEAQEKRKKPGPKAKAKKVEPQPEEQEKPDDTSVSKTAEKAKPTKYKPGPKSKQKREDPYEFDTDSLATNTTKDSEDESNSDSEKSDNQSIASSSHSYGSNELLIDTKKKKRKRSGWQSGVIKPKNRKKKDQKEDMEASFETPSAPIPCIPDYNCFTDKNYCFRKSVTSYGCRLCFYTGDDIVNHYKKQHSHTEIPMSRMDPVTAVTCIKQCEEINFQVIMKMHSKKYTCIFCHKEFSKSKNALESFFWHIVSTHTGEYKQTCPTCVTATRCPFSLDIPPPPKAIKGQLIGYICGKCNFTQISLENLKTHVIVRHNDEQTEVYTINLGLMSNKMIKNMLAKLKSEPRVLRSRRSAPSVTDASDDKSVITEPSDPIDDEDDIDLPDPIHPMSGLFRTKITFEMDEPSDETSVKTEPEDIEAAEDHQSPEKTEQTIEVLPEISEVISQAPVEANRADIGQLKDCAHFKLSFTESGSKEYVCCINGVDSHYKTSLLISMKKHLQNKHQEQWDGYCSVCKVIVTLQGVQSTFKDCFTHYLDKHMDDFPILEKVAEIPTPVVRPETPKAYIAVRPLSDLISKEPDPPIEEPQIPKIENVVSLGEEPSIPLSVAKEPAKPFLYEEVQKEIMAKKHSVVLNKMLKKDVLIRVFKCAGLYCSYTTDSAHEAFTHASTHQQIGGEGALTCAYCNFDCSGNAIDVVTHVFNVHSHCQYSCSLCFYRAASSQLVVAHFTKMHSGRSICVLKTTVVPTTPPPDQNEVLSREQAVPYYVCYHGEGSCKFRTYIASKFNEHIATKHSNRAWHACSICHTVWPTGDELVEHLTTHGVMMYQCSWCARGARGETELVAHAAAQHPHRAPQAYVRVINKVANKEGKHELRILPLANLSKTSNIPVEEITPSSVEENAVREAERSIDLEKLIAHSGSMLAPPPPLQTTPKETPNLQPLLTEIPIKTEQVTDTLKDLPTDVICLDSDEENVDETCSNTNTSIENVSLEEGTQKAETQSSEAANVISVSSLNLLKCPYCLIMTYGSKPGLSRHLVTCTSRTPGLVKCPHEPCKTVVDAKFLIKHYQDHHKTKPDVWYSCGNCEARFNGVTMAKRHMKSQHKVSKICLTAKVMDDGSECYTVLPQKHTPGPASKRKSWTEVPVVKKYGPQDINNIPLTPIFDNLVHCSVCEFTTKIRVNLLRHLQFHNENQSVPQTQPVNPVPQTSERHFDKMVNLASSSLVTRGPEKLSSSIPAIVSLVIPQEAASRYPKFVPDRHRYACGAKGCSYISLNDVMLRIHWDTLHAGTTDYHCVHCPPYQHVDKSKPLTANRIIAHLKMHDVTLFACSSCNYYHYKKVSLEKHLIDLHKGGSVMVVREEYTTLPAPPQPSTAPTMDLKAWRCGVCDFKTMLRPEVVQHCAEIHQSKMQYKCGYCPFRTSAIENVTKHQSNSHPGKDEDIFYYFYKEGTIPTDPDGIPIWIKQKRKAYSETEIKTEEPSESAVETPVTIDLNIVKQEVEDSPSVTAVEMTVDELCLRYGKFCEPNGIKYKCCLCSAVTEHLRDNIKSHLFEELKYRRWVCGNCPYKAYHRTGLNDHMLSDHPRSGIEPTELPKDNNIERWVTAFLDHQTTIIQKNKENFAKQKIQVENTPVNSPKPIEIPKKVNISSNTELEKAFGPFGTPNNREYCCPQCDYKNTDEIEIRNHLENELFKIRWCCTHCDQKFQGYHEALFHCKHHVNVSATPTEAIRDPTMRCAWVTAVINSQRQAMKSTNEQPIQKSQSAENSLLIPLYAEPAPTDEVPQIPTTSKRSLDDDSEDDKTYEPISKRPKKKCPHCNFMPSQASNLHKHVVKHFNLKSHVCSICNFNGSRSDVLAHIVKEHPLSNAKPSITPIPNTKPTNFFSYPYCNRDQTSKEDSPKKVCLVCDKNFSTDQMETHTHDGIQPEFGLRGEVVVKCCICFDLKLNLDSYMLHHEECHSGEPTNYAYFKLQVDSRSVWRCDYCSRHFNSKKDANTHHQTAHKGQTLFLTYGLVQKNTKRKIDLTEQPIKRVAKKSTTKLPMQTVAKKSTTKLPFSIAEEYSHYGAKPLPIEHYKDVSVSMPMCNTMVDVQIDKLNGILKIDPRVLVKNIDK